MVTGGDVPGLLSSKQNTVDSLPFSVLSRILQYGGIFWNAQSIYIII